MQNDIIFEGDDALAAGQFGDVWKGRFQGKQVAIKVLKLYVNSDISHHVKVLYLVFYAKE